MPLDLFPTILNNEQIYRRKTVPDIKKLLREKKLKVTGTKEVLISRLLNHEDEVAKITTTNNTTATATATGTATTLTPPTTTPTTPTGTPKVKSAHNAIFKEVKTATTTTATSTSQSKSLTTLNTRNFKSNGDTIKKKTFLSTATQTPPASPTQAKSNSLDFQAGKEFLPIHTTTTNITTNHNNDHNYNYNYSNSDNSHNSHTNINNNNNNINNINNVYNNTTHAFTQGSIILIPI
eukprot:Pgem_evm1s6803